MPCSSASRPQSRRTRCCDGRWLVTNLPSNPRCPRPSNRGPCLLHHCPGPAAATTALCSSGGGSSSSSGSSSCATQPHSPTTPAARGGRQQHCTCAPGLAARHPGHGGGCWVAAAKAQARPPACLWPAPAPAYPTIRRHECPSPDSPSTCRVRPRPCQAPWHQPASCHLPGIT